MRLRPCFAAIAATTLAVGAVSPAAATTTAYDVVVIADSADGYRPDELGCPVLNSSGQVAFDAQRTGRTWVALRGDGGPLTTIAEETPRLPVGASILSISINDAGQVSFGANRVVNGTYRTRVYRGDGAAKATRLAEIGRGYDLDYNAVIGESGQVAYRVSTFRPDPDLSRWGLFQVEQPGEPESVYTLADSDLRNDAREAMSYRGDELAFTAWRAAGGTGLYTAGPDGVVSTVIETDDDILDLRAPSLGVDGEVAFWATSGADRDAILVKDGDALRTVASTAGPLDDFFVTVAGGPSLNADGTVAFSAVLDTETRGRFGLYVSDGAGRHLVIGPGDALAGSTVDSIASCTESLNDDGQIAYKATLTDGRALIVRADPVSRPTNR